MPPPKSPSITEIRKREHTALMVPIVGALLILPPLLTLFTAPYRIFGAPLETIYLFTVWIAMIVGGVLASRHMPRAGTPDRDDKTGSETRGDG